MRHLAPHGEVIHHELAFRRSTEAYDHFEGEQTSRGFLAIQVLGSSVCAGLVGFLSS
jgi:hypothetical protein